MEAVGRGFIKAGKPRSSWQFVSTTPLPEEQMEELRGGEMPLAGQSHEKAIQDLRVGLTVATSHPRWTSCAPVNKIILFGSSETPSYMQIEQLWIPSRGKGKLRFLIG